MALSRNCRERKIPRQSAAGVPRKDGKAGKYPQNSTVILVHGASAGEQAARLWWRNVILPLERSGLQVICAPIPMTSLTNDTTALTWALERTSGPVVLVGHAYSGAVIAAVRGRPGEVSCLHLSACAG